MASKAAEDAQAAAAAMAMAATELEYRVELLNKYKEGILSVGESSCIDRCAAKYWQAVAIVGQLLGSAK
eukprot:gene5843-6084_t